MTTHHAACSCGQLNLVAEGDPVRVSICHCLACQRRTGSSYGYQARFPPACVTVSGEAQRWTRAADSGNRIDQYFCPVCGATVYYILRDAPDIIAVPVGAFADPTFDSPCFSVYESRKHRWVNVPPSAESRDD
ncbi:MAG: GFA family protein [Polyangiales bacterium]